MTARGRGWKAHHGRHVASVTPPIRALAFDGHAKASPYPGPDDELRRRPKYVHLRASRFLTAATRNQLHAFVRGALPALPLTGRQRALVA
jgi:hypothetical protein